MGNTFLDFNLVKKLLNVNDSINGNENNMILLNWMEVYKEDGINLYEKRTADQIVLAHHNTIEQTKNIKFTDNKNKIKTKSTIDFYFFEKLNTLFYIVSKPITNEEVMAFIREGFPSNVIYVHTPLGLPGIDSYSGNIMYSMKIERNLKSIEYNGTLVKPKIYSITEKELHIATKIFENVALIMLTPPLWQTSDLKHIRTYRTLPNGSNNLNKPNNPFGLSKRVIHSHVVEKKDLVNHRFLEANLLSWANMLSLTY